jgi:hypothetical protein
MRHRRLFVIVSILLLVTASSVKADFKDGFDSYTAGSELPAPWSISDSQKMFVNASGWQGSKGVFSGSSDWHGSSRPTGYTTANECYELTLKARISSLNGIARHTWKVGNATQSLQFEMDQNTFFIAFPGGGVPFTEDTWYEISVAFCDDGGGNWAWHGSYRAWNGQAWGDWAVMGSGDLPAGFTPEDVDLGGIYAWDEGDPDNSAMDDVAFEAVIEPVSCYAAIASGFSLDADLNEDCYVDFKDFQIIAESWMQCVGSALEGDLDNDCYVTTADVGLFAEDWVSCIDATDPNCEKPWWTE